MLQHSYIKTFLLKKRDELYMLIEILTEIHNFYTSVFSYSFNDVKFNLIVLGIIVTVGVIIDVFWRFEKDQKFFSKYQFTDFQFYIINLLGLLFLLSDPFQELLQHFLDKYVYFLNINLLSYLPNNIFLQTFIYYLFFDFVIYWRHRLQHSLSWWWALHAIHHNQEQIGIFTTARNHILDLIIASVFYGIPLMILGTPAKTLIIVNMGLTIQQFITHANVKWNYGKVFSKILVSPQNHRMHHSRYKKHLFHTKGINFAVIFPIWDIIFGTYYWDINKYPETGVVAEKERYKYPGNYWDLTKKGFKAFLNAVLYK